MKYDFSHPRFTPYGVRFDKQVPNLLNEINKECVYQGLEFALRDMTIRNKQKKILARLKNRISAIEYSTGSSQGVLLSENDVRRFVRTLAGKR